MSNDRIWLDKKTDDLIERSRDADFLTSLSESKILKAQNLIKTQATLPVDLFVLLAALNLLNASIKTAEYKDRLTYPEIKGKVSQILQYLIETNEPGSETGFYINTIEKCAYIEIFGLQFSFHNISMNAEICAFADSDRNILKPWRGIRLQKIAGELFDISLDYKEMSTKKEV